MPSTHEVCVDQFYMQRMGAFCMMVSTPGNLSSHSHLCHQSSNTDAKLNNVCQTLAQ